MRCVSPGPLWRRCVEIFSQPAWIAGWLTLCVVFPITAGTSDPLVSQQTDTAGKVVGIKYNCVHVLALEKTLKLYREILGFELAGTDVLHGQGVEGMMVMKLKAGDCAIHLSLPSPEHADTVGPVGNTNHNHFMLRVEGIETICEQLKAEGYELENQNYARDKYTFFTGPNGEIVGLSEY